MMMDSLVDRALAEARPVVFWLDQPEHPEPAPPLSADLEADLVVVCLLYTSPSPRDRG